MNGLIACFGDNKKRLEDAAASGKARSISSVKLKRRHRSPGASFCMAVNSYMGRMVPARSCSYERLRQGTDIDPRPGGTTARPDAARPNYLRRRGGNGAATARCGSDAKVADAMDDEIGDTNFIDGLGRGLPRRVSSP